MKRKSKLDLVTPAFAISYEKLMDNLTAAVAVMCCDTKKEAAVMRRRLDRAVLRARRKAQGNRSGATLVRWGDLQLITVKSLRVIAKRMENT